MSEPDLSFFLDLEGQVWAAFARGDAAADALLLHENFLSVSAAGFLDRTQHAAQLNAGPVVSTYALQDARLLVLQPGMVILAYLALYRTPNSPGDAAPRRMYISSLWQCFPNGWLNVFSQDTGVA